jgi:hypothetical protein
LLPLFTSSFFLFFTSCSFFIISLSFWRSSSAFCASTSKSFDASAIKFCSSSIGISSFNNECTLVGRSSIKIAHIVLIRWQTWPPILVSGWSISKNIFSSETAWLNELKVGRKHLSPIHHYYKVTIHCAF